MLLLGYKSVLSYSTFLFWKYKNIVVKNSKMSIFKRIKITADIAVI